MNDSVKDAVLQFLLEMQRKYPTRHVGYPKGQIVIRLSRGGIAKDEISLAVDYLEDERFIKSQSIQGIKYYRLSSKAHDKLLNPSNYSKNNQALGGIRVFNDGGVLVLGDNYGSVTLDKRVEISNDLESLIELIKKTNEADDELKADLIQSAATIKAQINKPTPDKTILSRGWDSLKAASTISGAAELVGRIGSLISKINS